MLVVKPVWSVVRLTWKYSLPALFVIPVSADPSIAGKAPVSLLDAMLVILALVTAPSTSLLVVIELSIGAMVPVVGSRTRM